MATREYPLPATPTDIAALAGLTQGDRAWVQARGGTEFYYHEGAAAPSADGPAVVLARREALTFTVGSDGIYMWRPDDDASLGAFIVVTEG